MLEVPLVAKHQGSPKYPFIAQNDGLSGETELELFLDQNSGARFPKIVSMSFKDFGWAVTTASARWKISASSEGWPKDVGAYENHRQIRRGF